MSELRVKAHAQSTKLTNIQTFIDAHCAPPANQRWTIGAGEEVILDCSNATFAANVGCARVVVDGSLGDLEPYHPIALCYAEDALPRTLAESGDLGSVGCLERRTVAYLVADKHGTFRVVRKQAELAKLFAPILSPAEALSWALLRGSNEGPRAEIHPPKDAKLLVDSIDATFAGPAGDAFRVRLFESPGCGCHKDALTAVDVLVSRDGSIREEKRQPVYETDHTMCRD
jgi:hypothetical protein